MGRMPTSIGSRAVPGGRGAWHPPGPGRGRPDTAAPGRRGGRARCGAVGQGRPGGVERRVSSHSTCGSWSLTWSWYSELIRAMP